jgi:hypothetical protein
MKRERVPEIICFQCKHLDTERIGGCKAFPGEIPDIILSGQSDHHFPLKGQEGDFVFTPLEEPVKIWKRIERSSHQGRKNNKHALIS